MSRVLYIILALAFCSVGVEALACSLPVTKTIPPETPDGEFVYVPPLEEIERFKLRLKESRDIAVVKVYADVHRNTYPTNAQTEFRVLHGWGRPLDPVVSYIRPEPSCGKPEKFEVGKWYIAIGNLHGSPWLMAYDKVEDALDERGEPSYVYTPNGRLPR